MAPSPSERISLVKEIARRMYDQDWGDAELIFREFALPHTREEVNSDDHNYIISATSSPLYEAVGIANSSPWRSITASISFKRNQPSSPNAGRRAIRVCLFRTWQNSGKKPPN
jgi:hypothetical protein